MTGANVWQYWDHHPNEYSAHHKLKNEILSYIESPDDQRNRALREKVAMTNLIQQDRLTFVAYYPVVEKMSGKLATKPGRGRPATRRMTAVSALQMQIDGNPLKKVTHNLCDCGKAKHDEYCEQQMRQSILAVKRTLRKCEV